MPTANLFKEEGFMGKGNRLISCNACQFRGPALNAHMGYKWYYFLLMLTGIGVIPLGIILIFLGNRTYECCSKCGEKIKLAPLAGTPQLDADEIWNAAKERDDRQFRRNKNTTALVFVTAAFLAIIWAVVVSMKQMR